MKPILQVEHLSKNFYLGPRGPAYNTLRDSLVDAARAPFRRASNRAASTTQTICALTDVNFEVQPGEVVGLIGKNGAGKSTLLKILSRITEPTSGRARLYGRIGSLLEVGTGFHPELTGRENVFLSGAILGMKREEIQRKFDEIVAFSEIEKFIDTPVKWYSSGMYLRLAFSVAAHLEPEIIMLDEVLAVGDASFQQKCLNKMAQIRKNGHTILFVSHNMQAVTRICKRALYLKDGVIVEDGPAHEVASSYLSSHLQTRAERIWEDRTKAPGDKIARLAALRIRAADGSISEIVDIRQPLTIEMEFDVLEGGHTLVPNYHFMNGEGICVFIANDHDPEWRRKPRPKGRYTSRATVPGNFLSEGILLVGAAVSTLDPVIIHFFRPDAIAFQVVDGLTGDSARGDYAGPMAGIVRPLLEWSTEYFPANISQQKADRETP